MNLDELIREIASARRDVELGKGGNGFQAKREFLKNVLYAHAAEIETYLRDLGSAKNEIKVLNVELDAAEAELKEMEAAAKGKKPQTKKAEASSEQQV